MTRTSLRRIFPSPGGNSVELNGPALRAERSGGRVSGLARSRIPGAVQPDDAVPPAEPIELDEHLVHLCGRQQVVVQQQVRDLDAAADIDRGEQVVVQLDPPERPGIPKRTGKIRGVEEVVVRENRDRAGFTRAWNAECADLPVAPDQSSLKFGNRNSPRTASC